MRENRLIYQIKLRMFQMGMKQKDLAALLGIQQVRVSEYLSGKRNINMRVARLLHSKLGINAELILNEYDVTSKNRDVSPIGK